MAIMNIGGYQPISASYPYGNMGTSYGKSENSSAIPGFNPNKNNMNPLGINQNKEDSSKVEKRIGLKNPNEECETCENRKYQDGSDEHNVSFKAAAHIDPNAAASAVRAHENQHVSNAYKKAAQDNGKVLRASVTLHTSICPECGRSYVSGGTTNTQIKYYNEENPYQKDLKQTDGLKYTGMNVDLTA